jgi:hypothetical protein
VEIRYDTTDTAGTYDITGIDSGSYSIISDHAGQSMSAMTMDVDVVHDTVEITPMHLLPSGSITVELPSGADVENGYLYIPGTEIHAHLKNVGDQVMLESVPAGTIAKLTYSELDNAVATVIRYDIPVESEKSSYVYKPQWRYARSFKLNTSASGAGVAGTVVRFPVLIRLNADNFDFSQARTDGLDIRFTKSDGIDLFSEIERWDPGAGAAELWVKMDTVFGDDTTRSYLMYWGNDEALPAGKNTAVFDTGAGFAGVWHFSETGDTLYDATANRFDGVNTGTAAYPGLVGLSRSFVDESFVRIPGLLGELSTVSLSVWARSDTSIGGQEVISIGDAVLIRLDDVDSLGTAGCYHNDSLVGDYRYSQVPSRRYLMKTGWRHLVFLVDNQAHQQQLFIDGVLSAEAHDTNSIKYQGLGTDTYIGYHANGKKFFDFNGQIDEVRVNKIALTPDWIRLCFMNQRADDKLVQW